LLTILEYWFNTCGRIWLLATTLKNAKTAKSRKRFYGRLVFFHLKKVWEK